MMCHGKDRVTSYPSFFQSILKMFFLFPGISLTVVQPFPACSIPRL